MKIEIREFCGKDIDILLDLMKDYYEFDRLDFNREKSKATLHDFMNSNSGLLFVIESSDKAIGYFCLAFGYSLELHGKDCFLDEIYISDDFRRKGVGLEVMKFIEEYLKKIDIKAVHLIVFENNTYAQKFYLKNGFRTRDAIFMTKSLIE